MGIIFTGGLLGHEESGVAGESVGRGESVGQGEFLGT